MSAVRGIVNEETGVVTDVYPVGVLKALQCAGRCLYKKGIDARVSRARRYLRMEARRLTYYLKKREWRNLKNSFNGYLAEHRTCRHNAGRAWTKTTAYRRVERICELDTHARRVGALGAE